MAPWNDRRPPHRGRAGAWFRPPEDGQLEQQLPVRALSEAETLGASKPAGNHVPPSFEFALPIDPYPYDPAKAR